MASNKQSLEAFPDFQAFENILKTKKRAYAITHPGEDLPAERVAEFIEDTEKELADLITFCGMSPFKSKEIYAQIKSKHLPAPPPVINDDDALDVDDDDAD